MTSLMARPFPSQRNSREAILLTMSKVLVIAAATFWIYAPSLRGGWLWDDNLSITQNPLLLDPARLWKIWFAPGSLVEYYPLEQSVQWMQWQFWSDHPFGYRLTNLLLHIVSSLLVWHLFSKLGLRLAWLGGLIFAIHPLQVESVAWISELKNTLSLPPFLLAICAYIDYEETRRPRDYGLALGLFLAAMLCKSSMAFFPAIILLYAWWKRRRIGWQDLKNSTPFFVIAVSLAVMNIWAGSRYLQAHHSSPGSISVAVTGLFPLLALAGQMVTFYFTKYFWPLDLLAIYPPWKVDPPSFSQLAPLPLLFAVLYGFWRNRESWGRHGLFGLGFFLISLVPVFGLVSARYRALTWSLDHMAYIPLLGLIGLTVAILGAIDVRLPRFARFHGIACLAILLILLVFASHGYASDFINSETLWNYTLQHSPGSHQINR
jgi:hypothetical protein